MQIEEWGAVDSIYWAIVTLASVGYGDVVPITRGGKWFTIIYVLIAYGIVTKGVTDLAMLPHLLRTKKQEQEIMLQFGALLTDEQV